MDGPSHDLHSGVFGGAVMNPVMATACLIASLHDQDGEMVAIDGFYNDVRPLLDWEREAAAALPITDADIRFAGVSELAGEPGFSAIERGPTHCRG